MDLGALAQSTATNGQVLTWNTANDTWQPQAAAGASGSAGEGAGVDGAFSRFEYDSLYEQTQNSTGSSVAAGVPVYINPTGGNKSFSVSGSSDRVDALVGSLTTSGADTNALISGTFPDYEGDIYNGSNISVNPISSGTDLFYDFANNRWTATTIGDVPMADVVSSQYYLASASTSISSDLNIDDVSELANRLNRTSLGISSPVVTLPALGEGQALNDDIAQGDEFAFVVNLGVFDITTPAGTGFKTVSDTDVSGGIYRLTAASNDEGVRVYRDGDNWRLRDLNEGLLSTSFYFSSEKYNSQINSQNITNLSITDIEESASGSDLTITDVTQSYKLRSSDDTKVVIFADPTTYNLGSNSRVIFIDNVDDNYVRVETHTSTENFDGTTTNFFYLKPYEKRHFIIYGDSIAPVGEMFYEVEVSGGFITNGNDSVLSLPSDAPPVFEIPSGSTTRLNILLGGELSQRVDLSWIWFVSDESGFISPALTVDKNKDEIGGGLIFQSRGVGLFRLLNYPASLDDILPDHAVVINDYLTYSATNLTSSKARGQSVKIHVKLLVKGS